MKCLIVDDNPLARGTVKQLLKVDSSLELIGECEDAAQAYQLLSGGAVDLIFLDIELEGMSGIELVKSFPTISPIVIFTTSKTEYAAEAFELNVADYLTKPITPARFLQSIEKAKEIFRSRGQQLQFKDNSFIFIRDSTTVRRLRIEDVHLAEAMGDYVKLHTPEKFFLVHSSLKEVEARLPREKFLRVHRSFIVQVGKIDTLEGGTLIVGRKSVPVADSYRAALNQRLDIL